MNTTTETWKRDRAALPDVRTRIPIPASSTFLRKLFAFAPEQYAGRNGGFTRITKLGPRLGDGAEVVVLELL